MSKIIKFTKCEAWCPYSSRYDRTDISVRAVLERIHSSESEPACLKYSDTEINGHFRLVMDDKCFKEMCYLTILK